MWASPSEHTLHEKYTSMRKSRMSKAEKIGFDLNPPSIEAIKTTPGPFKVIILPAFPSTLFLSEAEIPTFEEKPAMRLSGMSTSSASASAFSSIEPWACSSTSPSPLTALNPAQKALG